MGQAIGVYSQLGFVREATLGVTPSSPEVKTLPFNSCTVSAEQNMTSPQTLTGRRDPVEPILGNVNVGGEIVVPLDVNAIGYILAMAFGNPTTTTESTGVYKHIFKPGNTQPSFSLERKLSNGDYYVDRGCKVSSLGFNFGGDGELVTNVGILGCGESVDDDPLDASPTAIALDRVNNFQAALKEGGSNIAIATEMGLNINFGLDENGYAIGGGGQRTRINEGLIEVSGSLTAFYDDDTLIAKAIAATETSLQVKLTKGTASLTIDIPELLFARKSPTVENATGVMQTLNYNGYYKDNTNNTAIMFTLINGTASYAIES